MTQESASRRRRPARRGEGGALRSDIVDAAAAMIAGSGDVSTVTLRGLAREIGVAATSIYLHFDTVEEVVEEVKRERFTELARVLREAADAAGTDPAARLRARGEAYVRFSEEHPGDYAVMFAARLKLPAAPPRPPEYMSALDEAGVDLAAALEQRGHHLTDAQLATRRFTLWTAMHGMVSLRLVRTDLGWPTLTEQLNDLLTVIVGPAPA